MISTDAALGHVFDLLTPVESEKIPLRSSRGRILSAPVAARRSQPPFDVSAMDGYAIAEGTDLAQNMRIVGEVSAGEQFSRPITRGEAVRIFTGAPVPRGTGRVLLQENAHRDGSRLTLDPAAGQIGAAHHIRPAGADFHEGARIHPRAPLRPADIALIAAMGHGEISVSRRPDVAILPTGDELVPPGDDPGPGQIFASNHLGLAAMVEEAGGRPHLLPIAPDERALLIAALDLADGADLIVTIGGASVGDHDLVAQMGAEDGFERTFHKVAMRPGKPFMAGRYRGTPILGLPGNPVSSMICGRIFLVPALRVLLGLPAEPAPRLDVTLAENLPANGPREHYMRARRGPNGYAAMPDQDSARLSILAEADALIVRPPHDPARSAGDRVQILAH